MPSSACRPQAAQFIPIRCIFFNKLTQDDKLVLAFDASVLAQVLGRDIPVGKIIHGDLRHCVHCSRREEAPSENAVRGSTGDSPVPSGDPPDGTEATPEANTDDPFERELPVVLVGGSPTGAGEPPALPILQTNSPDGIDDPKTGTSAAPTNRPLIPSFSPDGGEGARRADEGDAAKLEDAIREFESCDLSRVQPRVTKVKTSALAGEVRKRLEQIAALLSHRTDTWSADSLVRESQTNQATRGLGGPRSGVSVRASRTFTLSRRVGASAANASPPAIH